MPPRRAPRLHAASEGDRVVVRRRNVPQPARAENFGAQERQPAYGRCTVVAPPLEWCGDRRDATR